MSFHHRLLLQCESSAAALHIRDSVTLVRQILVSEPTSFSFGASKDKSLEPSGQERLFPKGLLVWRSLSSENNKCKHTNRKARQVSEGK
jgi:hypothetical protein